MKTFVEKSLERIRTVGFSARRILSCDIYYNQWGEAKGEQFVVKVHDHEISEHFRSNHIRKALKQALKFVESL